MQLEFDPAKEAANLAKHGVDFSTVLRVFEDPNPRMINHRATVVISKWKVLDF
jgi:uncharacterized DUF497 family protein